MDQHEGLAQRFEAQRGRLRGVAYRMLGSLGEAEDAVQEAWLRLGRADSGGIDNLEGWLTTGVARGCLDMLRSRKSRGGQPPDDQGPDPDRGLAPDPQEEALLADSVGLALLVVLDTLAPDRKSTRLNSSHLVISYAVFCLKKKKLHSPFLSRRFHIVEHLHACVRYFT